MTNRAWLRGECPVCGKEVDPWKKSASGDMATCSIDCGYKWREIKRKQKFQYVKPNSPIDRFILGGY